MTTLRNYIEKLNKIIENNPEAEFYDVIYARDDEGNGYQGVYYGPSTGFFDSENGEFTGNTMMYETEQGENLIKVVCLN